jgi:hypothetical protein
MLLHQVLALVLQVLQARQVPTAQMVQMVSLGLLGLVVRMELTGLMEQTALMAAPVPLVLQGLQVQVLQVLRAHQALAADQQGQQERLGQQAQVVALPELQAPQAQQVLQGRAAPMGLTELTAQTDLQGPLVPQEQTAQTGRLVSQVPQALQVRMVPMELTELTEPMAALERQAQLGLQVQVPQV